MLLGGIMRLLWNIHIHDRMMVRGGLWQYPQVRASVRRYADFSPVYHDNYFGFRVCWSVR
jgi:hypothetical protein